MFCCGVLVNLHVANAISIQHKINVYTTALSGFTIQTSILGLGSHSACTTRVKTLYSLMMQVLDDL